jgi:hypothetical protein
MIDLWANSVESARAGPVQLLSLERQFVDIQGDTLRSYRNPMPLHARAFGPDYPDPADYISNEHTAGVGWKVAEIVAEQLGLAPFHKSGCASWEGYWHWASLGAANPISDACQRTALAAMQRLAPLAAVETSDPAGLALVDQVEQIAAGLPPSPSFIGESLWNKSGILGGHGYLKPQRAGS